MNPVNHYPFMNIELNAKARAADLVSRLTLEEKIESMMQYQPVIERLGIRAYKHGTEAAHGMAWLGEATAFPQPIGLGCTWNPELMKAIGSAIGDEARVFYQRNPEANGLTLWAPTVDMERDPRWGRTEEAYGEDPVLTGELTAALVQGLQGDHPRLFKTVATLKHFIGNNNEINRGSCSASIDPRNMKEYYQAAFKPAFVKGGAKSMMTSYNSVNGTPTILHGDVKAVVKGEWSMDGFIVSDAGDLLGIVNDHHYYATYKEAVAHAVKAGIDSITDDKEKSCGAIREALAEGLLAEADLDEALRNTFGVRIRLGEFDPDEVNPYANTPESKLCDPEHGELSRRAAIESTVLLKNDPLPGGDPMLPLDNDDAGSIAVLGPLGDVVYRDWYSGTLAYQVTPFEGIVAAAGSERVTFHSGNDIVSLRTADGRALVLDEDGAKLSTTAETSAKTERFELTDWGWGSHTLRSLTNGKLLSSSDDTHLAANADEAYGWFVKEIIGLAPQGDGESGYGLATWNGKGIIVPEAAGALTVHGEDKAHPATARVLKNVERDGLEEAALAAKEASAAIVVVGNNPLINGKEEIDRQSLELPHAQQALIRAALAANPRTVVVIVGSYPFTLGEELEKEIPAIVYTSHGGQELGHALGAILFGKESPAGRLNMTWYKSANQLTDIMDYDIMKTKRTYLYLEDKPLYPFGHGLSYARFAYDSLSVKDDTIQANDVNSAGAVSVTLTVTNDSAIDADEVVQLYVRVEGSRVRRPLKKLIAFRRVSIAAGASKNIAFCISAEELAMWDVTSDRFVLEQAEYVFMAGASSADIRVSETTRLAGGTTIAPRDLTVTTRGDNYDDYENIMLDECKEGGSCVTPKSGGSGWISFEQLDAEALSGARVFAGRVLVGAGGGYLAVSHASVGGAVLGGIDLSPDDSGIWKDIEIPLPTGLKLTPHADGGAVRILLTGEVKLSHFKLV
ncbi:glycoside hydrolase family 3 C-terminal domain-containing protein [Paenibacillus sp. PAMC21692]|uniref:glycoside hydrolase family 3 C-terminal domain-containing protein n=1 Tax=Paenibacillus sp. PAMC21692 TaxID=2762320 RepID=UPI00164E268E|nr:glycoside hydrolase family 3 C-terminal domain-containing protein [Paenibacillus sp. PAMC21692]QNK56408.1 glycoside hydrolase family 3 C-terminal domain-containing protein [Paenibacillus sp. PAMC21692]